MTMSMSVAKKLTLGTAAGVIAMIGALVPAFAKGGHHRHHFRTFRAPIVMATGYIGCDAYYRKWQRTGSRYWRSKYLACIT
jgi:hypothetical protein